MKSLSYFQGKAGDARLVFELNEEDACVIFDRGMKDGETPVEYLKAMAAERRQLKMFKENAQIFAVCFLVVLFFLRRFIP